MLDLDLDLATSTWISRCPGCCWYWAVPRAVG